MRKERHPNEREKKTPIPARNIQKRIIIKTKMMKSKKKQQQRNNNNNINELESVSEMVL